MKKGISFFLLLLCAILLQQCKGKSGHNFVETSDTLKFFPVNIYFKGQIAKVDSLAAFIYQKTNINRRASIDSTVLSKAQFKQLAQTFIAYDINDNRLHKYYKESTFADETTRSINFNYTAMDTTLPLQSVDVLLDETGTQLKNVFLSLVITNGDSTVTEKAGWKNNESFFINSIIERPGKPVTTRQNVIVWQFRP